MIPLIDSHCHLDMLDLSSYDGDISKLINETHETGIETLLTIGVDLQAAEKVIAIASAHPQVFASVGVHPSEVAIERATREQLLDLAQHQKVVAIGETARYSSGTPIAARLFCTAY